MSASLFSAYSVLLLPICVAVSLGLCLAAKPIATALNILDIPGGRKSHRHATPLMGGVTLLAAFFPWIILWALLNPDPAAKIMIPIALCSALLTILGLIDDRRHLSAILRLVICFTVIGATIIDNPELSLKSLTWNFAAGAVSLHGLGAVFSILSIVALIQGANLADGKNGLLIGLCLGWVFFIGSDASATLLPILFALSAILIVLLVFNLPGQLFLGDGGSYGLATFIGLMALLVAQRSGTHVSSDRIGLVFLLPVIDMVRLMVIRTARGQSPFAGDRDHLHHHLLSVFGWPGGLVVYLLLACLPSFVAANAPRWTLVIISLTIISYLIVIYGLEKVVHVKRQNSIH